MKTESVTKVSKERTRAVANPALKTRSHQISQMRRTNPLLIKSHGDVSKKSCSPCMIITMAKVSNSQYRNSEALIEQRVSG